ncbi:MAG: HlyC/CorC family transporter [Clostridiales bacterium]|nr:HlyC/CorC family transporter [Clostridiales bacterium]
MGSEFRPYVNIVFLLICSAFFSASEIAYASLNKLRLKKASEEGRLRARWAQSISDRYDRALCVILLGNNLVNIAASATATVIAISLVGERGAAYAAGIMTVVILLFGEVLPKQLAKENADRFALLSAPLLKLLITLTRPIVAVVLAIVAGVSKLWGGKGSVTGMTEDELVTIIETVEDEGVIDEGRSDLLQSAIEFSEIEAQEIITHRVDMLAIDVQQPLDEIIEMAMDSPYSRIPVYEGSVDNIIGAIYLNHLFKRLTEGRDFSIRSLLTEVCYVHKTLTLPVVLAEMQRRKIHLTVVIDEYGGTLGILTMEDILEQLVGDIWDESDEIYDEFREVGENLYEVDGTLGIYDFLEYLDMDDREFEDNFVTMGGWAIEMLGGFPSPGDHFAYRNLTITVEEMEDLRVVKLRVQVHPRAQEGSTLGTLFGRD